MNIHWTRTQAGIDPPACPGFSKTHPRVRLGDFTDSIGLLPEAAAGPMRGFITLRLVRQTDDWNSNPTNPQPSAEGRGRGSSTPRRGRVQADRWRR